MIPTPRRTALLALAAAGLSAALIGCDSGAAAGPSRHAARETERPAASAAASVPSETPTAPEGPAVPEPTDEATAEKAAAEPTTAKPQAAVPDVTLTSAERPAGTAPAEDASKYPGGIIPASPNSQPLPGGPRLLVPEHTFRAAGNPRAFRVSFDDLDLLRVLNIGNPMPADVVELFPKWLRDLDGKTVRIRGFMYPAYEEELSAFIFTRDTGECCFGPEPRVYYRASVKMKEGTKAHYIEKQVMDVVGTFHIEPRYVDGTWYQLYKITDAVVEN